MRIISKYRDYYDIGMQYGYDESLVWVRDEEKIEVNYKSIGIDRHWFNEYNLVTRHLDCPVQVKFLAFCGKLYSIHIGKVSIKGTMYQLCTTSFKELKDLLEKLSEEEVINYKDNKEPSSYWYKTHDLKTWIGTPCHELHRQFDCPVMVLEKKFLTKCPRLKDVQFQRVKDSYTAYQEISMYISGIMGQQQNPMVTLSDKSKIEKHGFDYKLSFRKGKENK